MEFDINLPIDTKNSITSLHAQQINFIKFPNIDIFSIELNINNQSQRLFFSEQIDGPQIKEELKMPRERQYYNYSLYRNKGKLVNCWFKINGGFSSNDKVKINISYETENESNPIKVTSLPPLLQKNASIITLFVVIICSIISYSSFKVLFLNCLLFFLCFIQPENSKLFILLLYITRISDFHLENLEKSITFLLVYSLYMIYPILGVLPVICFVAFNYSRVKEVVTLITFYLGLVIPLAYSEIGLVISLLFYTISFSYDVFFATQSSDKSDDTKFYPLLRNVCSIVLTVAYSVFLIISLMNTDTKIQTNIFDTFIPLVTPYSSIRPNNIMVARSAARLISADYDFSDCPLCHNPLPVETHSSKRDLIIIFATFEAHRAVVPIRTIRTAGCQAKILLITDETTSIPWEIQRCGVTVVTTKVDKEANLNVKRGIRFPFMQDFLPLVKDKFDRILYMDGFDTVFQSDPFPAFSTKNTLHYSGENHTYRINYVLSNWRERAPNFNVPHWMDREVKCNGLILADLETMWKISYMENALFYRNGDNICEDQTFYEFLIEEGMIEAHGIKLFRNKELASILWSKEKYTHSKLGYIKQINTSWYPAIVHQAMNIFEWRELIWQSCR